jgi:hypothetical protein
MAEFNPDDVDYRKRDVVVLQTIQPHHALVKSNRFLLRIVYLLIAMVFLLGLMLIPRQNILEQLGRHKIAENTQNPVLSAEVKQLRGQMFGLVSGSIESKLKSLEDNIRKGSISDSLETISELKSQIKLLDSYSQEPSAQAKQAVVDEQVFKELSELKGLIYLTLVSCGLMIAAIAGVWLRNRYRLTHQQSKAYLGNKKEFFND